MIHHRYMWPQNKVEWMIFGVLVVVLFVLPPMTLPSCSEHTHSTKKRQVVAKKIAQSYIPVGAEIIEYKEEGFGEWWIVYKMEIEGVSHKFISYSVAGLSGIGMARIPTEQ